MTRVVITGAAGHLGRKLFDYLRSDESYQVLGLDIREGNHPDIHKADFTEHGDWIKHLEGVDVLVHLAADREPSASWDSAIDNNMNASLNLYHAAVLKGVKRVVFASSNWLHGGYRFSDKQLTPELSPHPVNAYGVAKLFGERVGEYFTMQHSLSVICLRIGWTQWTHNNQPGRHMAMGSWGQEMWLSDRDFLNGTQRAIDALDVPFAILNLVSDNKGMRWDIETTKAVIGYEPKDHSVPQVSLLSKFKSKVFDILVNKLPRFFENKLAGW